MRSWKEVRDSAERFEALDAAIYGVSVEPVETLRAFRERLNLPYTLLSDPMMESATVLELPRSTSANFLATAALHPEILRYPKRAFLQPAMLVWGSGEEPIHAWRQTEKLRNLLGATGRPTAQEMLDVLQNLEA